MRTDEANAAGTAANDAAEMAGARCLDCGYALRGLTSWRCPECGRAFHPADPWTVRFPHRPNRLARWLMRPPTRVGRSFPLLAVLATAWGTRVPGWEHAALQVGMLLLLACAVETLAWWAALAYVRDSGYDDTAARAVYARWSLHVRRAAVVMLILIAVRPTMFVCFWASRPWLDRVARDVLAQPFAKSSPYVGEPRGVFMVQATRRCPHGVKLHVGEPFRYGDSGPGFVYIDQPGECSRFRTGFPLGGGWYTSD